MRAWLLFPTFCLGWGSYLLSHFFHHISSTDFQYSTLGGGSLTLGSSVVLELSDVGSAVLFVAASDNIADSSLSAKKVFSFKVAKCCVVCG